MIDYVVYSTSNSDYQSWQCKLLEYSFKKVNQQGKLIRLCSYNTHCPDREFDTSDIAEVIKLPDYRTRWTEYTNNLDKDYGIANKTESLKYWLSNYPGLKDTDVVLLIDPDMVFLKPIEIAVTPGNIIGQKWEGEGVESWGPFVKYGGHIKSKISKDTIYMYPYIATVGDLKKIIKNYLNYTYGMRLENYPHLWESEMFSLIIATLEQDIKVKNLSNLGFCITWNHKPEANDKQFVDSLFILHYPSSILDEQNQVIFNKQDYTPFTLKKHWDRIPNNATTLVEKQFLQVLDNYNVSKTIDFYWENLELTDSLNTYSSEEKYIVFKPWPGGPNNVRLSLELASCIAFLLNCILVIPSNFFTDHLQNRNSFHLLFDINDLGIKTISFDEFKNKFNISSWDEVPNIAYTLNESLINTLLITDKPEENIVRGREILHLDELKDKNILYFNENLLGNFYLNIYSKRIPELCKFVARHIHFKKDIFIEASKAVELLGEYYAIHIRRGDFQYEDLLLSSEQIYNNIKNIIPQGAKLYISTDESDKSFFSILEEKYNVKYYNDIKQIIWPDTHKDLIGSIEQLICAQAKIFIGNKLSTFSSYIYRLRGYLDKEDKRFLTYNIECHPDKEEEEWWMGVWAREYPQGWNNINNILYFTPQVNSSKKVFVSVASYRDTQLTDTIDSLFKNQSGKNKIIIGVCMQDTEDNYNNFKYKDHPDVRIHFMPYQEAKGVGYARNYIQQYLFQDEDYFLQIDSHSRACPNWDLILIEQINACPSDKSILSTYPNAFDVADENETYFNYNTCPYLKINSINPVNKKIVCGSAGIVEGDKPILGFWCAAGFLFTKKEWTKEVEYSKDLYFTGEEDHLSIMSYVKGWDVYVPPINTIWHDYTDNRSESIKKYRPLHWEDHPNRNDNIHLLQDLYKEYDENYDRSSKEFITLAKQISNITGEDEKIDMETIFDFSDIPLPTKEVQVIIFAFCNKNHVEIFRPDIYNKDIVERTNNKLTYRVHQDLYNDIEYCIWMYKYTDDTFSDRLELMIGKKNNKCKVWYM